MADCVKVSEEALLAGLRQRGPIFAPNEDGRWARFEGEGLPAPGPARPRRPLRDLFTPPVREIAHWKGHGARPELQPATVDNEPGAVFGVRPCDARALQWLDEIFLAPPHTDTHYQARREALLLIGVACQPQDACLCGLFDYGPDDPEGLDVMLHPTDGGYLAVAGSERGAALLDGLDDTAAAAAPERRAGPRPDWWPGFPEPQALLRNFEHPVWDELQVGCMNCGACTLYCPTCQCFNIVDESYKDDGQRLRVIDSCQHSDFTRMAGGHNPRTKRASRLRQRVLHKFAYIPERHEGRLGCTGCGRCVELCGLRRHLFADLAEIKRQISEEASCG